MTRRAATDTIRVLVADEHPLFREGVAIMLEDDPSIELVAMVGTAREALDTIGKLRPHVVIVDFHLPDGRGADVCLEVQQKQPDVRFLMMTASSVRHIVMTAFTSGAHGYLMKTATQPELLRAVRTVAAGGTFIDPAVADHVVYSAVEDRPSSRPFGLTRQEMAVLEAVEGTVDPAKIGERLGMSVETVETHLSHAMEKVGADDPASAAEVVRRQGPR